MTPHPFAYPSIPHKRKHGPHGYDNYESYRSWLRDEFSFRCVFCLQREQWPSTRRAKWDIDHLLPRKKHLEKVLEYDNLIYLCRTCNGNKRAKLVPDPCRVALGKCLRVDIEGRIFAKNRPGRLLRNALRLDNKDYTDMRRLMIGILATCALHNRAAFLQMMGYPKDLPDLAGLKPEGNSRPEGIAKSFFALRATGALAEVY